MSFTTPRTWTPGLLVTANHLNTDVRDNINSLRSEHFSVTSFTNLHLRSHPDSDIAAKAIWFKADEVVMSDATRLAFTTAVSADITAAGANGLDSGLEAASVWYEAYAIAKDDGTKGAILHRAKDYRLDTSFVTALDVTRALRLLTATATDKLAQGIQLATTGPVEFVDITLRRVGSVVGNVWLTIEADTAGSPSGTPLITSSKFDASLISTTASYLRFVYRTPVSHTLSTQYHIVLQGDYPRSDTVFVDWGGVVAGGYSGGSAKQYNGAAWSAATGVGDFQFRAYVTENNAAVTLPSGYTKQCLVGYAYNNSGSNLIGFIQQARHVRYITEQSLGSTTATIPTLTDVSAFLPPNPVRMLLRYGTNAANSSVIYGGVPHGYDSVGTSVNGVSEFQQSHRTVDASGAAFGAPHLTGEPMPTEYQGLYVWVGGNTGFLNMIGFDW